MHGKVTFRFSHIVLIAALLTTFTPTSSSAESPKQYTGKPISFDLNDTHIWNVLHLIAEEIGQDIILEPGIAVNVTLKVEDVPWDQVLDMVLDKYRLSMEKQGDIILVTKFKGVSNEGGKGNKQDKTFTGKPISLDLNDCDINNFLRTLADLSGEKIVAGPNVAGKITMKVQRAPWDQVLDMGTQINGLVWEEHNKIIQISKPTRTLDNANLVNKSPSGTSISTNNTEYISLGNQTLIVQKQKQLDSLSAEFNGIIDQIDRLLKRAPRNSSIGSVKDYTNVHFDDYSYTKIRDGHTYTVTRPPKGGVIPNRISLLDNIKKERNAEIQPLYDKAHDIDMKIASIDNDLKSLNAKSGNNRPVEVYSGDELLGQLSAPNFKEVYKNKQINLKVRITSIARSDDSEKSYGKVRIECGNLWFYSGDENAFSLPFNKDLVGVGKFIEAKDGRVRLIASDFLTEKAYDRKEIEAKVEKLKLSDAALQKAIQYV